MGRIGLGERPLGYPTSNKYCVAGLLRSTFVHGFVTYDPATRATVVHRS